MTFYCNFLPYNYYFSYVISVLTLCCVLVALCTLITLAREVGGSCIACTAAQQMFRTVQSCCAVNCVVLDVLLFL